MAFGIDDLLIPVGLGALGAWAGSRGGGDVTTTTQMIPPPLTTQQQILLNQMTNWLYQAAPQYQQYIDYTLGQIYGQPAASALGLPAGSTEKVPGQLTGEMGEKEQEWIQTEAGYQRDLEDYELAKSEFDLVEKYQAAKDEITKLGYVDEKSKDFLKFTDTYLTKLGSSLGVDYYKKGIINKTNMPEIFENIYYYTMDKRHGKSDIAAEARLNTYNEYGAEALKESLDIAEIPIKPGEALEPTPELVTPSTGTAPTVPAEAEAPWSPFAEIMSWTPEKIAEYYGIERTKQQREIEDWYGQAQREASQRGISQYGGYEGSGTARDIALLAAEKARMSTSLGESMRQMQLAHEMQQPYEMLSAAQGLIGTMSGLQQPWLQLGTSLASPYGPSTQISTQPGIGSIQGAVLGGLQGLGVYGTGQSLGWWGGAKAATPYGAGLIGPTWGNIPNVAGTGYEGYMPGYAW